MIPEARQHFLFRTDASSEIGIGHFMRSLAMAQAFMDLGHEITFLCLSLPLHLRSLLKAEDISFISPEHIAVGSHLDAQLTAQYADWLEADWIIADGYQFDASYQNIIKTQGHRLMLLDDYGHSAYYFADILLNTGLGASQSLYKNREPSTLLLLGPEYMPIRREFLIGRHTKKIRPLGKNLLVTMGGSDPTNMTAKILKSLAQFNIPYHIRVIIGPAYSNIKELLEFIQGTQGITLFYNVKNMLPYMLWADLAISAGGGTLAEMAYIGLPSLIIKTAANQRFCHLYDERYGASLFLGNADEITENTIGLKVTQLMNDFGLRRQMSLNGQKLIDGLGAKRLLNRLISFQ